MKSFLTVNLVLAFTSLFAGAFTDSAEAAILLNGKWVSQCVNWSTAQNEKDWSRTDEREFKADGKFVHNTTYFRGFDCTGEIYYKRKTSGTFEASNSAKSDGFFHLDLKREEEVVESYDEKHPSDKETLSIPEKDIFLISRSGKEAVFGKRIFRLPRLGEDFIDQLAERPSRLWQEHIYMKNQAIEVLDEANQ